MESSQRRSLRVVLFTVLPIAIPVYEAILAGRGHKLVALFTAPGPRTRQTLDYRQVADHARPGLDVVISNQPARWAALLSVFRPDLMLCCGFNWKLPAEVLAIPPYGAVNVHGALLPKGRGINSIGWTLRDADPRFGLTFHYMTPNLDDGPILSQAWIPLTDDDDIDTLTEPFFGQLLPQGLRAALERVESGDPGDPQDEAEAMEAPQFDSEWRYIDWSKPAREIHLQVRSWWGNRGEARGALGEIDGSMTRVIKTQLVRESVRAGARPGTVLSRDDDSLLIQCGDGPLRILRYHPEPESSRV
jgi:methionyl-tRNA formyltransferase